MYHSPSTQPLPEEQSPTADETENTDKFGYLISNNCWHEIPVGETKIGRDASLCSVILDDETVSKVHAVIESEGAEDTFIYDADSMNKTKIGKMKLKPHCRYKINDNDVITLGGISVKFKVIGCKFKNYGTMTTAQLCSPGESATLSDNGSMKSPIGDKTRNGNCIDSIKNVQEIFKSPSMSVFKAQVKSVRKHYYISAGEDSPAADIFNQTTQCEVKDTKQENNSFCPLKCISDDDDDDDDDDDIYNLSTQCEEAGVFLKPEDKTLERLTMKEAASPKLEKSLERIGCDFNESGTFDFVKGNKSGNCIKLYMSDSFCEDIFELSTQCHTTIKSIAEDGDELNFKNKINQPMNSENDNIKLISKSSQHENSLTTKVAVEERNVAPLSDGEDEELCKLMRMNSPLMNTDNGSKMFKVNLIKTELTDDSNEIFDIATQVPSNVAMQSHAGERITLNEANNERDGSGGSQDNLDNVTNDIYTGSQVMKTKMELKKSGEVPRRNATKNASALDEDMILTQVYSPAHHISETKERNRSAAIEEMLGGDVDGRSRNLEDLIPTQLFEQDNCSAVQDKQNDRIITHSSQDDIATQVYPLKASERSPGGRGGKPNEENQVLSVIIEEAPPKPEPEIVSLCDSGDETESDLEIKLCLNSVKKEGKISSDCIKRDPEALSPRRQNELGDRERPPTASSDKTVSDLDIAELEEASSALIERNNCEDFIATQLYPSKSEQPETSLYKSHFEGEKTANKCEDFIATHIFAMVNGSKSPSEISDKTVSDIVGDTRRMSDYEIIEVSSEEENCDIDDNSNESESLIKEIDDNSSSSSVMATVKRSTPSPELLCGNTETLTLTPSHPVFEAFSEIDGLIGKASDKSDSGIGAENIFDKDLPENGKPDARVASDSDETDCEAELEAMKAGLGRQETFVVSKSFTEPGRTNESSPLVRSEDVHPSTSKPSYRRKAEGPGKACGNPSRTGISKSTKPKKSENSIKSYFPTKADAAIDSPLKRTLVMNSDEGIPKKRVKSLETRKKRTENIQTVGIILTQSMKLRNRVIRQRKTTPDSTVTKKKTAADRKTSGRDRQMTKPNSGNKIETTHQVRISKKKTSAIRKLAEEFEVLQEDSGKKSLRRRKSSGDDWKGIDSAILKIVFTGFESDCHDRIIQKLGGERVNNLDDGHILVTDRVRRTVKFLSAVALGLPIVSPKWLVASEKEMKFLNPWNFLLEDTPSEERWGFNLKATVEKWRKQKLLKDYTVFATESTRPPVHEILSIVRCCGGSPVTSHPDTWPEKSIVLTCIDDKKSWPPCKYRQVKIVHYELLLSGVLRHFMDFKTYKLR